MVSSRQRSLTSAVATPSDSKTADTSTTSITSRAPKQLLEEWTIREKLCLASLAIKHNNSWSSVVRQMQTFVSDKDRQEGRYTQKICAAQFDKLMNELGVDKRPKRNEQSDTSGSVIYKKMAEKRIKELEEDTAALRKKWLERYNDLKALDSNIVQTPEKSESTRSKTKPSVTSGKTPARASTSTAGDAEKPSTRALTRRESSRQNLEKTLATLYKEASEIKAINQFCRPSPEIERSLGSYDKLILNQVDLSSIKKRLGSEVDDPYAVMNDFLLIFQNATMYYPNDHPTHKLAVELRDKLVPQWERSLLDRFRAKH